MHCLGGQRGVESRELPPDRPLAAVERDQSVITAPPQRFLLRSAAAVRLHRSRSPSRFPLRSVPSAFTAYQSLKLSIEKDHPFRVTQTDGKTFQPHPKAPLRKGREGAKLRRPLSDSKESPLRVMKAASTAFSTPSYEDPTPRSSFSATLTISHPARWNLRQPRQPVKRGRPTSFPNSYDIQRIPSGVHQPPPLCCSSLAPPQTYQPHLEHQHSFSRPAVLYYQTLPSRAAGQQSGLSSDPIARLLDTVPVLGSSQKNRAPSADMSSPPTSETSSGCYLLNCSSKRTVFFSQMGLWSLLEGLVLLANGFAILNEDRFLAPRGWSFSEVSAGGRTKSLKGQLIGLIYATQYLRVPLIIFNIIIIFMKMVSR
ncbi:hypothetical protein Taro_009293 [Colocasia esculenta]|uniref:Yos1-like protein n=1 Tax=Colocasia esculenta TaxID=4460 RepID=A0A843TVY0_COLES|nr:hypothetical protein [Colocasia esculenta]